MIHSLANFKPRLGSIKPTNLSAMEKLMTILPLLYLLHEFKFYPHQSIASGAVRKYLTSLEGRLT